MLSRVLLPLSQVARAIKCHVNEELRQLMAHLKLPVDQPYRHLLVQLLNLVLGTKHENSRLFWTVQLKVCCWLFV